MAGGRPRTTGGVKLPAGVHTVRSNGKIYYYWHPGRSKNTKAHIRLQGDPLDPAFWQELNHLRNISPERTDDFDRLIDAYMASPEWIGTGAHKGLRGGTKKTYEAHFRTFRKVWGKVAVKDLTRRDIFELRDAMSDKLYQTNKMLGVLQTLLTWALSREWRNDNPARDVPRLKAEMETGYKPWPEAAYAYVMAHAPTEVRRMVYLGRATGQRREDLIRICPAMLMHDGIHTFISKKRDQKHFVPLLRRQIDELQSWIDPVLPPEVPFIHYNGSAMDGDTLHQHWFNWRKQQRFLDEFNLTIHGLKVTAICDRHGIITHEEIAKEIGMSARMVERYVRFIDAQRAARASRDKREALEGGNVVTIAARKRG